MEVLYHSIKTWYAYDFPLCFPHELLMSLRNIYTVGQGESAPLPPSPHQARNLPRGIHWLYMN